MDNRSLDGMSLLAFDVLCYAKLASSNPPQTSKFCTVRKHFTYKYIDPSFTRLREEITRISHVGMYYLFKAVSCHQRQFINTMM